MAEISPEAAAEAALAEAQAATATADAHFAAVGPAEIGTPEGDRGYDLDHAADVAWDHYQDVWHAAYSAQEPEAQ